jgi:hypothetical protein
MFHIAYTSQTRAKHEVPNVSPLWTKAAFAALMLVGSAQAGMADSGAADIPPAPMAQAHTLCSGIIGVDPGDGRFNGCVASLAASLQSARQEHAIIQARSMCFARGLKPGSSDLALCLLEAAKARPFSGAADPPDELTASAKKADQTASFHTLTSSLGTISDREQQACARTGFDPAFGAFASCVADLQNVLQNVDMPPN